MCVPWIKSKKNAHEKVYYKTVVLNVCNYNSAPHPLPVRDIFQDPQQMSESLDSTDMFVYYVFSHIYITVTTFNYKLVRD